MIGIYLSTGVAPDNFDALKGCISSGSGVIEKL
jgi:hypothetical protein